MLINLSNHPSEKWEAAQLEASSQYGEIIDIPFPNIPPECTAEEVRDLALLYLQKCENLIQPSGEESAIHITGELTFCFALIQILLKKGYKCITTTSERDVWRDENGGKIVNFNFKHFREYKLL